jgi:transcription initiation factor TFIIB
MTKSVVEEVKSTEYHDEIDKCNECGSTHLIKDYSRGEVYCESCGLVIQDSIINEEEEWRSYTPEQSLQRSRVGLPQTYTLHDRGLSTEITSISRDSHGKYLPRETKTKFYRMRKLHNRLKFSSQKEKRLAMGLSQVDIFVSHLGLPKDYKEAASLLYRKAAAKNLIRGRSVQTVAAAVIYTVCRMNMIPRTLDEVCKACSLDSKADKKKVGKAYKAVIKTLKLKPELVKPEQYLSRFCAELGVSPETRSEAARIIKKIQGDEKLMSTIPAGVVAAAIYIASQKTRDKITQKRIADTVGISEPTLRYRYHDLTQGLNISPKGARTPSVKGNL